MDGRYPYPDSGNPLPLVLPKVKPVTPGARVPAEFIGLARLLRNSLIEPSAKAEAEMDRLIAPLRPRPGFTPMARHKLLREMVRVWQALPDFGRLGVIAEFADGKLRLADLRCRPVRMKFPNWDSDELALGIKLTKVICAPPTFKCEKTLLVDVGMHALARRFERGDRSNATVLSDLVPLLHAYRSAITAGADFEIRASSGRWRGSISNVRNWGPVLAVRTFI